MCSACFQKVSLQLRELSWGTTFEAGVGYEIVACNDDNSVLWIFVMNYHTITDSFVVTTSIFTLFEHFLSHTISFIFNLRVSVRLTLLARRKSSVPSFHFRWTFLSLSSNICWRMGVSEPFLSLEVLCMHKFVFWIDLYFEPGVGWRDFSSVCSDCVVMLSSS